MKKDINEGRGLEDKMRQLRLVLVQPKLFYDPKKSDADNDWTNINHAVEMISTLKPDQHDLIVLPELYPCVAAVGVEQAKPLLDRARQLNAFILAGETYKGKNASTLIDSDGCVIKRAYKVNVTKEELNAGVKPGKEAGVFEVRGTKVGVLTCWDFAFPNLVEDLLKRGAEIIAGPSMNVNCFVEARRSDARHYSAYYRVPFIAANLAGVFKSPWGTVYGGGKSEIVEGPNKDVYTLDRPATDKDFRVKSLGLKEGLLKYALKLK